MDPQVRLIKSGRVYFWILVCLRKCCTKRARVFDKVYFVLSVITAHQIKHKWYFISVNYVLYRVVPTRQTD